MNEALTQLGLAVFGLSALWMAMSTSAAQQKWAPVMGLAGQVFWSLYAWQKQSWGIAVLVVAYTIVYTRGAWMKWIRSNAKENINAR